MERRSPQEPGFRVLLDEETLSERVSTIHSQLKGLGEDIARIAVAVYDRDTDTLRTFVESTDGGNPLVCYERPLSEVPSLRTLVEDGSPRVIDDLWQLDPSSSEHTRRLLAAGYRSSFTVPLFSADQFVGFVFFDAASADAFPAAVQTRLAVYSQLLGLLVSHDRATIHTLRGAIRTALQFSRFRDEETAAHLARVAHYARLTARELEPVARPNDEYIEYLFQFAPMHDIGKIAIPDHILLKRGRLTEAEMAIMRTHVTQGAELVDTMVREFELGTVHHIDMLRNLILYHHENYDGSGYLEGLTGTGIPLEARILKAADALDALTTARPYKRAWSVEEAFEYLESNSGSLFDPSCVQVLVREREQVMAIRKRFQEEEAPD